MDFIYTINFTTNGHVIVRRGRGLFYPHNVGFNIEDMLWQMTEEFGRPEHIDVKMEFFTAEVSLPLLLR